MLVNNGHLRLLQGPAENRHRPAIDPLFRTAALSYGSYTIGVILTGYLDDGTAGLMAIKSQGGTAIVQDPGDATVPNMPQSALDNVDVDYTVPLRDIAPLLVRLVTNEAKSEPALKRADKLPGNGKLSVFTCPECQGTLFEEDENGLTRYRCRVGHIYSPDSMFADQSYALERALWAAVRSLEEHAELSRRLAERARRSDHERAVRRFQERWRASMADAEHIRRILTKSGRPGARDVDDAQKGEELRSA
jgi:two-component system chemotaxis response regulator CheB